MANQIVLQALDITYQSEPVESTVAAPARLARPFDRDGRLVPACVIEFPPSRGRTKSNRVRSVGNGAVHYFELAAVQFPVQLQLRNHQRIRLNDHVSRRIFKSLLVTHATTPMEPPNSTTGMSRLR